MAKKQKKPIGQKLLAQWPGVVGLGLIGFGVFVIYSIHQHGHNANNRGGVLFIVIGMALLAYWSFANRSDDYNF